MRGVGAAEEVGDEDLVLVVFVVGVREDVGALGTTGGQISRFVGSRSFERVERGEKGKGGWGKIL